MSNMQKNRSGSASDRTSNNRNDKGERRQTSQPGAPQKSNRQTGDHERDDSNGGAERNTTKKGANSI